MAPATIDNEPVPGASSVQVIGSAAGFTNALATHRSDGALIGLVPTMGALHAGHESLITRALRECDVVAVSIFVNPLQFSDPMDLEHYPRTLDSDIEKCRSLGVSVLFTPGVSEMYPHWPRPPAVVVSAPVLANRWEGAARPGHFEGVATVVTKLFVLSGACRAYFGEKDFQQLSIVRRIASDLGFPVQVVACPTVREVDGLALSSRNVRLSAEQRRAAVSLWRALDAALVAIGSGERRPAALRALMGSIVETEPAVSLEYAEAVDAEELTVPQVLDDLHHWRLIIAASVGSVRLIDNLAADVPALTPSGKGASALADAGERTPLSGRSR